MQCGADLVAIAAAAARQEKAIEQEKRAEAAMRPTLLIAIIITLAVVGLILVIAVQGSRQAAIAALTPTLVRTTPTHPPLPTATPRPTFTPTPTATSEKPPEYVVKNGDTPGRIALLYDVSVESLMAFNGKAEDDVIVVGETLKIPVPTKVPTETSTPIGGDATSTPAASGETVYVVQEGDTLSGIAEKFHVSIEALQQRNNIQDIQTLHVGDQIIIPGTITSSTSTPAAAAANAGPAAPASLANYPAVTLLTPLDREIFIGNSSPILLQWLSAGILRPTELYRVQIEQVGSGKAAQSLRTRATSWHLPIELFPPPGDPKRVFRWSVEIIRQVGTGSDGGPVYDPVSPANEYSFEWLDVPPTPTSTTTPLPGSRPAVLPTATP
jgi:LysM repeat protein